MDITQPANFESPTGNPFLNIDFLNLNPLWENIKNFFQGSGNTNPQSVSHTVDTILIILALFFLTLIAYCAVRLLEIRKREHEHLHHEIIEYAKHQRERESKQRDKEGISTNPRWRQVLEYTFSISPGDWKLAVIEADSMLDDLMDQLGFKGENLGDKLKNANQDKFKNLTKAWEVHTIRNRIAHEGADFQFSAYEAKRVIAVYEQIFREFGFI